MRKTRRVGEKRSMTRIIVLPKRLPRSSRMDDLIRGRLPQMHTKSLMKGSDRPGNVLALYGCIMKPNPKTLAAVLATATLVSAPVLAQERDHNRREANRSAQESKRR